MRAQLQASLLLLASWSLSASDALAAKFIEVKVLRGDEVLLRTSFTGADNTDAADLWADMEGRDFQLLGKLAVEEANADRLVLKGKTQLTLYWPVNKVKAAAAIEDLVLVPSEKNAGKWRLTREEVERTALAAGLELSSPGRPVLLFLLFAVGVLLIIVLLIWITYRVFGRNRAAPEIP